VTWADDLSARAKSAETEGSKDKAPTAGGKAFDDAEGDGTPAPADSWEDIPEQNPSVAEPSDPGTGSAAPHPSDNRTAAGSSPAKGEIDYGSIGADGRRSGIVAEVTPNMLGTGRKASQSIKPPGFVSGANGDARGHLLPKALGGSGNTPENFVRTTAAIDNGVMNEFEKEIAAHVSDENTIIYSATPHYRLGSNVPFAVSIEAFDDFGWYAGRTFMQ
jgi:hypothetical protein